MSRVFHSTEPLLVETEWTVLLINPAGQHSLYSEVEVRLLSFSTQRNFVFSWHHAWVNSPKIQLDLFSRFASKAILSRTIREKSPEDMIV